MNEQTRQHYLSQMGVNVWYSRFELPGAAVSSDFDFEDEQKGAGQGVALASTASSDSAASDNRIAAVNSAASILNKLNVDKVEKSAPAIDLPSASVLKTAPAIDSAVKEVLGQSKEGRTETAEPSIPLGAVDLKKTSLSPLSKLSTLDLILYVGKRTWFLSDNNAEFPDALKQALLLNIAAALGEDISEAVPTSFSWPFFGNSKLPGNDPESMMQLLFEWLGQRIVSDRLHGFLMGEQPTQLLLNKTLDACLGKEVDMSLSDERGITVVPLLSLNDLLREPQNKRSTWQIIKSYKTLG